MPCYFWQGTFWWYISWLFPFGSFSTKNHIRMILLEVMGSEKAPNTTLLVVLNYIITGAVIFNCLSYIILWWKKNGFRLVFETFLLALKRCYIHMYIFLEIGKLTCSKTLKLTKNHFVHFNMIKSILLNLYEFEVAFD